MYIYLFTFWPPGPDDLLNETSQMLRGIVSASKFANQRLAASSSSSSPPFSPLPDPVFGLEANTRVDVQNEVGHVRVTKTLDCGRRMAMDRIIMAREWRVLWIAKRGR